MIDAVICDLDGTLALFGDAHPYDRDYSKDTLNEPVARILVNLPHTVTPIFVSGRTESARRQTQEWLVRQLAHRITNLSYHLFMRQDGDNRKDSIVKREIYEAHIKGAYNILFVLDDRNQVVDMWRKELGLTCFQVNYGDF